MITLYHLRDSYFVCFCFLSFAFLVCTVTARWIMYRSYSVLFCMHIVVMTDVATALIRWICKMQLSFRLDTSGVGRKKSITSGIGIGMAKENKSGTTKPQKCHTVICEPWSNKGTMRKPRLPPARSLEITECKPHGQHSHRYLDLIQRPAMTLPCGKWKVVGHSETWCEKGSRVLYTQERSRWLQLFYTELFWFTKLPKLMKFDLQ